MPEAAIYHSYTDTNNGTTVPENRTVTLSTINLTKLQIDRSEGDPITSETPGLTTEVLLNNRKVNNVKIQITDNSMIITYNGNFTYVNNQ